MKRSIRVATRGSRLARTQTRHAIDLLAATHPECAFEVIQFTTTGDQRHDRPLTDFRGTGVFVKELQRALLDNEADIAVHSLKDVPIEQEDGLTLASFPERADPADVLLTATAESIDTLARQAVVGTGSPRRMLQLGRYRSDLQFRNIRGNLDTRLRKLDEGQYDAIVLAAAGLIRLGHAVSGHLRLPEAICLPAAGQGMLALECRRDDAEINALVQSIHCFASGTCAAAERSFLRELGAGCSVPAAALARVHDKRLHMKALLGDLESGRTCSLEASSPVDTAEQLGRACAQHLAAKCAKQGIALTT
ncbi:MAG: hydroxymethylbilane synthase [Chitinivibrionales bacterium]|nr:hydroxymethylbilane synthase [Chitinivibrionales bacterium]